MTDVLAVRDAFDESFDGAFHPTPDDWTATIGGNALECNIVRESLTIRMGKDDTEPVGQADASTATFEIIGEAFVWTLNAWSAEFVINFFTGVWSDAPRAIPERYNDAQAFWTADGLWWESSELADRTFAIIMEQGQPAFDPPVTGLRRQAVTARVSFEALAGRDAVGRGKRVRLFVRYLTANPWNEGGELLAQNVSNWVDIPDGVETVEVPMAAGVVPMGTRWIQVGYEGQMEGLSAPAQQVSMVDELPIGGPTRPIYVLDTGTPDAFEPGEKVVIKRNGATVWTGWVTDEQRSWQPSIGSTSTVNAAGPRGQYNQRRYVPRWGTSGTQYGDGVAYTPLDPGPGGYTERPLVDWVNDIAPYMTHGVDQYLTGEPQSYKIGMVTWWKGADLELAVDILDGAANATFARVWEKRDGRMAVFGSPYYRFEAPNDWYLNDTTYLNCDEIGAPVEVRREAVYANSWVARWGPNHRGTSLSGQEDQPAIEYYEAPPNGGADREYSVSPELNMGTMAQAADKWAFMRSVWNARKTLEQVDRWTIRREFVSDATWQRLMTMWLGWPVVISNLPPGLFRDGRDVFHGFLWGWELRGTDEVSLTLIDRKLFA